jgi:regulator of protease activity HflC (stomatin/prohibitin superfamily)
VAIVAIFVVSVIISTIKVVKEYERGVIFRLGRVRGHTLVESPSSSA